MKEKQFDLLVREYLGSILEPKGFSVDQSKYCTFYKKASDNIYHIIMADLSTDGSWFDIRVFATSPLIEPQFDERFPDELGVPSDSFSLLHPRFGVGPRQQKFRCKTKEGFIRNFKKEVVPAVEEKAIPYLNEINSLEDSLSVIRRDFYRGAALYHIGEKERGEELLEAERERLSGINDDTGRVSASLDYIDAILVKH